MRRTPGTRHWVLLLALVTIIVTFTSVGIKFAHASPNPSCILNCGQCVQLYGYHFDGKMCAEVCIQAMTRYESYVDCADPTNIARFIRM